MNGISADIHVSMRLSSDKWGIIIVKQCVTATRDQVNNVRTDGHNWEGHT